MCSSWLTTMSRRNPKESRAWRQLASVRSHRADLERAVAAAHQ
jgi:hypothetical protein